MKIERLVEGEGNEWKKWEWLVLYDDIGTSVLVPVLDTSDVELDTLVLVSVLMTFSLIFSVLIETDY